MIAAHVWAIAAFAGRTRVTSEQAAKGNRLFESGADSGEDGPVFRSD